MKMAAYESISGSPKARLEHNLREKKNYLNEDINKEKTDQNYALTPADHGKTATECMAYFRTIMNNIYHRSGSTITCAEWVCTAPTDLSKDQQKEFFESTYQFLNNVLFGGDDSKCILAQVHHDEAGLPHMHYIFTFPTVDNSKYISLKNKFEKGLSEVEKAYSEEINEFQKQGLLDAVIAYERKNDEVKAIASVREILGLSRDDARWVFTRLRRLESEKYKEKMMSKDQFLGRRFFKEFHQNYQNWIDEHGPQCTVYRGGGGINLTVEQLKEITKMTGLKLDRGLTIKTLSAIINQNKELEAKVKNLEQRRETEREWGNNNDWGKEKEWGGFEWDINF